MYTDAQIQDFDRLQTQLLYLVQAFANARRVSVWFRRSETPGEYWVTETLPIVPTLVPFNSIYTGRFPRHKRYKTMDEAIAATITEFNGIYDKTMENYLSQLFLPPSDAEPFPISPTADTLASQYAETILEGTGIQELLARLEPYCSGSAAIQQAYQQLHKLIYRVREELSLRIQCKLCANRKLYQLPDKGEYTTRLEIKEGTSFGLPTVNPAPDHHYPYDEGNLSRLLNELDEQLHRRSNICSRAAYRVYHAYCRELECSVKTIGELFHGSAADC